MNTKANIIIIEDEKNICNFIETVLSPHPHLLSRLTAAVSWM